jgi:Protein of unknown function (DUF3551)
MCVPVRSVFLIAATLLCEIQAASAQSPTSYPWCARYFDRRGGATSCYFTSKEQCMTAVSGLGGFCYESPYYEPAAPAKPSVQPRRHRHT